jgi:DNA-binding Lrp family transcriptional regulator
MPDITMDNIDRMIIQATQAGLPVTKKPYHAVAAQTGLDQNLVMQRMKMMLERGVIRRIGAVPNHYRLGYRANGMSVWDVQDDRINELGKKIGSLEFVSHCYHRPRYLPEWPYNLFAMVHGRDRESTEYHVKQIAGILGEAARGYDILYSTRILKKTGLRI